MHVERSFKFCLANNLTRSFLQGACSLSRMVAIVDERVTLVDIEALGMHFVWRIINPLYLTMPSSKQLPVKKMGPFPAFGAAPRRQKLQLHRRKLPRAERPVSRATNWERKISAMTYLSQKSTGSGSPI